MEDIAKLIDGFKQFQERYFGEESSLFAALKREQKPKTLVIGCSDSRVDPALLTGCDPGELFVVRNVANLVPPCEHDSAYHGVSAALEYAVCFLEVEHIIILGHSGCGGIMALLEGNAQGKGGEYISRWVEIAGRARDIVVREMSGKPAAIQAEACEQISILISLENLLTFPWVSERVEAGTLFLHAWYVDISTGNLFHYLPTSGRFELLV
ncbi:MAG: carbonic anhydrase [Geobacteraceae bacterium]